MAGSRADLRGPLGKMRGHVEKKLRVSGGVQRCKDWMKTEGRQAADSFVGRLAPIIVQSLLGIGPQFRQEARGATISILFLGAQHTYPLTLCRKSNKNA